MPTALIIGASRGIGLELVRQYVADGWRVIATARDDAGRDRIQALGAQCLRVDVANPISVTSFEWMLDGEKLDLALYVAGVIDHNVASTPPTLKATVKDNASLQTPRFVLSRAENCTRSVGTLPSELAGLAGRYVLAANEALPSGSTARDNNGARGLCRGLCSRCAQHCQMLFSLG